MHCLLSICFLDTALASYGQNLIGPHGLHGTDPRRSGTLTKTNQDEEMPPYTDGACNFTREAMQRERCHEAVSPSIAAAFQADPQGCSPVVKQFEDAPGG